MKGVLAGQLQFQKRLSKPNFTNPRLRRNIHRLEKGLIMPNKRAVFAMDYIGETLEAFENSVEIKQQKIDKLEIQWAYDVLKSYFNHLQNNNVENLKVKKFIGQFQEIEKKYILTSDYLATKSSLKIPYSNRPENPVRYEDLLKLSIRRRSVRFYKPEIPPRYLIDKAIEIANYSPSACNRQPFEFRIFDSPDLVKKIANIPFGTSGYADNIPCIIVIVGDLSSYFSPRDRHVIYIDGSLAAMSFMLALETLGLSSCPINWPDFGFLEKKMKKSLSLKDYERPVMLISVGFADQDKLVPYSQKKDISLIRSYNKL